MSTKPVAKSERTTREVSVISAGVALSGELTIPSRARGLVIFAHGSGSSRHSPRNQSVAEVLCQSGLATLLLDLLTSQEESVDLFTRKFRFDIDLLARRLVGASEWSIGLPDTMDLRIGYFGSSTGAAAALVAAAQLQERIGAVVSRGGRPDLAESILHEVKVPTLLIVGERDERVLDLNQSALEKLRCEKTLEVIPGATHLFEEPGALEQVARMAADWFIRYL